MSNINRELARRPGRSRRGAPRRSFQPSNRLPRTDRQPSGISRMLPAAMPDSRGERAGSLDETADDLARRGPGICRAGRSGNRRYYAEYAAPLGDRSPSDENGPLRERSDGPWPRRAGAAAWMPA